MKNTFFLGAFALSSLFLTMSANAESVSAPAAASDAATAAPISGVHSEALVGAPKGSYSELKAECLKETPSLKGHELRKCVKTKKQALK